MLRVETKIHLNKFKLRPYQIGLFDAIENKGYKRALLVWPRRAGKDVCVFNLCIRAAIRKPQVIFYVFPTYSQGRKVIFDSLTNDGDRILDYIPKELIESMNQQELKIRFKNGSLLQVVGSDNYDSLMGTNPQLCVFSEYALQDPRAYQYIRPILTANDGCAIFLSTPRGKNHLYELYQIASQNPAWYCEKLTVEDTGHIDLADIEKELQSGEMSDDLVQQEYYTSFDMGVEGAIFGKYLDKMRVQGRIGIVPWETGFKVNTAWDIGRDTTAIIFFQTVGQIVRVIDYYEKVGENLEYFIRIIESKPYLYNKHFFPHDMRNTEWAGPKFTRVEKARQLGLKATIVDDVGLEDGIEIVRSKLNSIIWIDQKNCAQLIKCLEGYRRVYDAKRQTYSKDPLHNWASHGSDAMRYLCISLPKTKDALSSEELDRRYVEAFSGNTLPGPFNDDFNMQGFR